MQCPLRATCPPLPPSPGGRDICAGCGRGRATAGRRGHPGHLCHRGGRRQPDGQLVSDCRGQGWGGVARHGGAAATVRPLLPLSLHAECLPPSACCTISETTCAVPPPLPAAAPAWRRCGTAARRRTRRTSAVWQSCFWTRLSLPTSSCSTRCGGGGGVGREGQAGCTLVVCDGWVRHGGGATVLWAPSVAACHGMVPCPHSP